MAEAREELILRWLAEGRDALEDAEFAATGARWRNCIGRLYYACFHAVSALLVSRDYTPTSHNNVERLFRQHFGDTGAVSADAIALYEDLHKQRLAADHSGGVFDEPQVRVWLAATRGFLAAIEELLQAPYASAPQAY